MKGAAVFHDAGSFFDGFESKNAPFSLRGEVGLAEAQLYPTREGSGGRVPMNSGEGGLRRGGLSGGPGEGDGDTPKLLLQKSTALSNCQTEERWRGHWVEM